MVKVSCLEKGREMVGKGRRRGEESCALIVTFFFLCVCGECETWHSKCGNEY